jgi:cell division protease FtsH
MSEKTKNLALWAVIILLVMSIFTSFSPAKDRVEMLKYSEFIQRVEQGDVESVEIRDQSIHGRFTNNTEFTTFMPLNDGALLATLKENNVITSGKEPEQQSLLLTIFVHWTPFLLLIGLWLWAMRQLQGGGSGSKGGPMSFGRSRARLLSDTQKPVTFDDVAGVEEAKVDVQEFVDFLKDPRKFQKLGASIPCGALLVGPPGTGKTLLAKAVAGEADVPFFSISGSDFVEMFVGVGASRVRDMFDQAKKQAPCIIFIDEIDAVGRQRGAGLGGGNDEREQTLNQLLVEMDGFEGNEGVIVMAATNRPDVLDPALLRPGRFDRQVVVPLPDINGRQKILSVHLGKVVTNKDVDPVSIAQGTPGFSGADLANLVNEAALFAARENKKKVSMIELEMAKDKIIMGAERHAMVMNDEEKLLTAYHEAGHAIVGLNVPDHDPVHKVSIIPRGRALGVTVFLPERDQYSQSLEKLESRISALYGGRLAEEMIFGPEKVTTGASNDIERATELARKIVTVFGLTDTLGPINYTTEQSEVFLGKSVGQERECSEQTVYIIDQEVRKVIDRNYERARKVLAKHMDQLHAMADALMKFETIDKNQIEDIMSGKKVRLPENWIDNSKKINGSKAGKLETKPSQGAAKKPTTRTRRKKAEEPKPGEDELIIDSDTSI